MDESLQNLLKELPKKAPRSKLEPYRELIFSLLEKNWRYREIAALFKEKLGLAVAPSTLHNFVKVRRKRVGNSSAASARPQKRTNRAEQEKPFVFTSGETLTLLTKERKGK